MDEVRWLSAIEPARMIWAVQKTIQGRKPNLFAAACPRRVWHLFPGPLSRHAVETLKRFIEGGGTETQQEKARHDAMEEGVGKEKPGKFASIGAGYDDPEMVAYYYAEATAWVNVGTPAAISGPEELAQVALIRDFFGNPFHPVFASDGLLFPEAIELARKIYDEREFSRLPELADRLEMSGCSTHEILTHSRERIHHVRGCWVVDLLLGQK